MDSITDPAFHIGYWKTGTKWLQLGYFAKHPQIIECVENRRQWENSVLRALVLTRSGRFDPENCRNLFLEHRAKQSDSDRLPLYSGERLSGHAFSGGYDNVRIARRIASSFPKAKVLMVIRNQLTMLPSMYKELVAAGYTGSFQDMINPNPSIYWIGPAFSLEMLEYNLLLEEYTRLLPAGHVKVMLYEELRENPEKFVSSISQFLGVDHFFPEHLRQPVHKTDRRKGRSGLRVWNQFRVSLVNPYPVVNLGRIPKLGRIVRPALGTFTRDSTAIDEKLRADLSQHFADSNVKLKSHLTDYQLRLFDEYP